MATQASERTLGRAFRFHQAVVFASRDPDGSVRPEVAAEVVLGAGKRFDFGGCAVKLKHPIGFVQVVARAKGDAGLLMGVEIQWLAEAVALSADIPRECA